VFGRHGGPCVAHTAVSVNSPAAAPKNCPRGAPVPASPRDRQTRQAAGVARRARLSHPRGRRRARADAHGRLLAAAAGPPGSSGARRDRRRAAGPGLLDELRSPRVVQLKATLRRYDDRDLAVSATSHDLDDRGELLSQPVVTTPIGTGAAIDQKVRLEGGALELDLQIFATPRLAPDLTTTLLEHELTIHSRRSGWPAERRRVHLGARGVLEDVESRGHRVVFAVDDHLFSLDLELHRPLGAV
jgi:hypothetical protein